MLLNPVSFELADIHTLHTCVKQVQIIWMSLFLKSLADADILGLTVLVANILCQYLMI